MILTEEIEEKLKTLKNEVDKVEDFIDFKILALDCIEDGQVGYSVDSNGNSLVSEDKGSWKSEWIVIGYETLCGDPIIIDTSEIDFPVSSLMHGMGTWDGGTYLSESLDKFTNSMKKINELIYEKTMENTVPRISCKDLDNLIGEIIKEDEYGDLDSWKSLINPIYVTTKEYENKLTRKVNELSQKGMKINEIATTLNMSLKDTYHYLKKGKIWGEM